MLKNWNNQRATKWLAGTLAMLALVLSSIVPVSGSTAVWGDQIGDAYQESCGHQILVGFRLRQGSALNQLTPLCADLHEGGVVDSKATGLDPIGGVGGDKTSLRCQSNAAVVTIRVYIEHQGQGINDLSIVCRNLQSGQLEGGLSTDYHPNGGFDSNYTPLACRDDEIANGVMGHAAGLLFSIGLACSKNPLLTSNITTPAPSGGGGFTAFARGNDGYWGYNNNPEDEASARRHAVAGCGGSEHNCKDFWATTDSCVAFAMSPAPDFFYAAGSGTTKGAAESSALKFCQSGNAPAGSCEVLMSRCH